MCAVEPVFPPASLTSGLSCPLYHLTLCVVSLWSVFPPSTAGAYLPLILLTLQTVADFHTSSQSLCFTNRSTHTSAPVYVTLNSMLDDVTSSFSDILHVHCISASRAFPKETLALPCILYTFPLLFIGGVHSSTLVSVTECFSLFSKAEIIFPI